MWVSKQKETLMDRKDWFLQLDHLRHVLATASKGEGDNKFVNMMYGMRMSYKSCSTYFRECYYLLSKDQITNVEKFFGFCRNFARGEITKDQLSRHMWRVDKIVDSIENTLFEGKTYADLFLENKLGLY